MAKGSQFEREICRQLSRWWTNGKDDSVFWRTSQSGGRATQRAKKGQQTFGHYGDIAAVNPIGQPLVQTFTIELKRGRSHGCPNDLLDCKPSKKPKPFEQALLQAREASVRAGTPYWLLICRRDGRQSMAYIDGAASVKFPALRQSPRVLYSFRAVSLYWRFIGMRLDEFLERVKPEQVTPFGLK